MEGLENLTLLAEGSTGNAAIYEGTFRGRPVIVKDFRPKGWLVRLVVGRLSIRRERRAYGRLRGIDGIAEVLGPDEPLRLMVQKIDGMSLEFCSPGSVSARTFERLAESVDQMHARGFVHLDLTHRGNILLDGDGRAWMIDLAAGFDFSWAGGLGRSLARRLGFFDRAALAKWKQRTCEAGLTERESRDLRLVQRLRRFWILNPKNRP